MEGKSIKVNFIFNTLKTIMVVIFPLISFPYISRVLGVEGVGKVQYCTSVISYFILFSSLGIGTYSIREGVRFRNDRKAFSKFSKEILLINMVTTVIAYLVLGLFFLAGAFQGKRDIMLICSLSIAGTTLCIDWLYQAMEQYVYISVRTLIIQALSLVMMFCFVRTEQDAFVYALLIVFSAKGYCFLNLFQSRKYIDYGLKVKLEFKKHIKPILVIFGATLAVSIYMNMDVVMLGIFCDDYQVGLYSAAVKVNTVVKNVIVSISAVLLPRLMAYIAKGDRVNYEKLFQQGTNLNLFFSVPSMVGLIVLSRPIILLFSGEKFLPAVFTGQILAIRLVFAALDNIFYNQVLIPNGHEKEACIGTAAGAGANLILNALLIPAMQTLGAAIATVISEGVVFVYFVISTKRIINLKHVLKDMYKFLVAAVLMGIAIGIGMNFLKSTVLQLLVLIPLGIIIYVSVLWLLKRKGKDCVMNRMKKRNGRFKWNCLIVVLLMTVVVSCFNLPVYAEEGEAENSPETQEIMNTMASGSVKISYSAHVQKRGWLNSVSNGEKMGTTGSGLRMEALKIHVINLQNDSGDILYRSHIQTYGWENSWKKNGELSGTTGQAKRLEAIQIKLTGMLAEKYDVYYRVHVQTYGWLDWAKNGTTAGSTGYSKRIEAIQVILLDKGKTAPGAEQYSYISSENGISYSAHVQTYGWQSAQTNGLTAGTSGQSKRMESLQINLKNCPYQGNVEYQSHVQGYGWETEWKSNGQLSGTVGQSKRLEAVRIRLTEELAQKCDIYYRVHCQHYGWLGWAKNGEEAGTSGYSYRMEAIQILLLPKGARTFSDEVKYVSKSDAVSDSQWNVSEITTNLKELQCDRNETVELNVQFTEKEDDSVRCYYTWENVNTGETGDIGTVRPGESMYWTPAYSGSYIVTMTATDDFFSKISRQICIEVNHGAIHKEDAFFTAHMGLSSQAPNNSIPAFILAGENGFDSIEADVNETKDGVFIISHDDNLINICGVDKNISDLTYAELQDYTTYHIISGNNIEIYSDEELRLPTLAEYIEICMTYGCIPQIDIKNLNSFESVLELYDILCAYGLQDQTIVTSFDNLCLQMLRNLNPNIMLTYGVDSVQYLDYEWLENNNIGISLYYPNLLSGDKSAYLNRNFDVNVYTVNDKKTAGILLEQGVNSITTNWILWE